MRTTAFLSRVVMRCSGLVTVAVCAGMACQSTNIADPPCPRPPFALVPALDTVRVSGSRQIAPGPELSPRHGAIVWSSSDSRVAVVDQNGVATAISAGKVELRALDTGSAANCPDQWYGTLVVR